jgi:transcriptional regulator GlxA family with amidase domain
MEQNLADVLPMSVLAKRSGVSQRQLQLRFRAAIGTTPQIAYLKLRLKHARWLMR